MKTDRKFLVRRELLTAGIAAGVATLMSPLPVLAQDQRKKLTTTPSIELGPFYPVTKPLDEDADLTIINGQEGRAQGQVVHLVGRVLNRNGDAVRGAKVEIWQANTHGRYSHLSDPNPAPLDPNFQGYGMQLTDEEGQFRFKTIKPGPYPLGSWMRSPHIHFDVTGRQDRKATQMFFEGESLNDQDLLYKQALRNKEALLAQVRPHETGMEPDSIVAAWTIIIANG